MLLSDTLGVTSLVNCLNHRLAGAAGSTEWTVQVLRTIDVSMMMLHMA